MKITSIKKIFGIGALLTVSLSTLAQTIQYSWQNLPKISRPEFKKDTFDIVSYGAKAGLNSLNTVSINRAITACSKKGGGVVLIPSGVWVTGPVIMKSNVNLCVSIGAFLQFTADKTQYALVEGDYEGLAAVRNQSPISGTGLQNIAITGGGIIDGHGDVWRPMSKDKASPAEWNRLLASGGVLSENGKNWYPSQSYALGARTHEPGVMAPGKTIKDYAPIKDFLRPVMVVFTNCKKILLQDVTFKNSAAWCLHPLLCQDITLAHVKVNNPWNAQNGDGIDVESCKNVLIEGSTFDAGDDGICIKSGRDEEGRRRSVPAENIVIRNDVVHRAHGGFVIGSEMSGGARNIFVSDCTFIGTDIGLRFKTTRGRGGVVEKIYIKNVSMKNIVHEAILFDMYYMTRPAPGGNDAVPITDGTPQFRDFYVDNVLCDGAETAMLIRGLPEMSIKGIHLENIKIKADAGINIIEADDITLHNVQVDSKDTNPLINIKNGRNIKLEDIEYSGAHLLLKVSGKKSANISISGTDLKNAKNIVEFKGGAQSNSLVIDK